MSTLNQFITNNKNGLAAIQDTIYCLLKVDSELYSLLFTSATLNIDGYTVNVEYIGGAFRIVAVLNYGDVEVLLTREDGMFVGYIVTDDPLIVIQSRSKDFNWTKVIE